VSEFRQNPATKEWVIVAPERAKRPDQFARAGERKPKPAFDKDCPFCRGNEAKTPPEVYRIDRDGDWGVRVVPNKFAALHPTQEPERVRENLYLKVQGFGVAEVVIETPEHHQTLATMAVPAVRDVLMAYLQRYHELAKDDRLDLITIFRNHGERAGTSLEHPHSQIIATPIVPINLRHQIERAQRYSDDHGLCVYCTILLQEQSLEARIVVESRHFIAFEPHASRSPFETWIMPHRHASVFGQITPHEIDDLALVLRMVLAKLYYGIKDPDYNYVTHSAPVDEEGVEYFHNFTEAHNPGGL